MPFSPHSFGKLSEESVRRTLRLLAMYWPGVRPRGPDSFGESDTFKVGMSDRAGSNLPPPEERIYFLPLRGEPVGLVPRDDRFWAIHFGPLSIGLLDNHTRCILHMPPNVLPMSPV